MLKKGYLTNAKIQIEAVRGKALSGEQRNAAAIALAALILNESRQDLTVDEIVYQNQLGRMMDDPNGKAFLSALTDQCFRTSNPARAADQLTYSIDKFGVPGYLDWGKRIKLLAFKMFGKLLPSLFMPLTKQMIRREMMPFIVPGEDRKIAKHLAARSREKVRVNLNRLGEAILGEEEAQRRLQMYLDDLKRPDIEYISIKISTLYSQLNLLAKENTLEILAERLRLLYREALKNKYMFPDGKEKFKFINLDMEEYRDLQMTVDLFKLVLSEPEFYPLSAGIVLQSYLPDSYLIQQELTLWALQRVKNGAAPIKIRLVKGANLAMEQVDASLHNFSEAPYPTKVEVDANYKRMLAYGCEPLHAQAVHLGVGSHNLFDIAYALLLRAENGVENLVEFEMLEGMADPMRRCIQMIAGQMLLYCPVVTEEEFQYAVAYLVRRLDENTSPENFLRHAFSMIVGTKEWQKQADLFSEACQMIPSVSSHPRRGQNRFQEPVKIEECSVFENEPDTDWALPHHSEWAEEIVQDWSRRHHEVIPLVIGGDIIRGDKLGTGIDPSCPDKVLYYYTLADESQIDKALSMAKQAHNVWAKRSVADRSHLLGSIAHALRRHRAVLIGAMLADTAKTVMEADTEVSEAIDFAEYYRRTIEEIHRLQDIKWRSKGVALVAPPWNFPCSIPAGGILSALAAGNTVIFKPAPEAVLVGWELVNIIWEAGIGKDVLQFVTCEDEPVGSKLIQDPSLSTVILTGATTTARQFLKMRPGLDLIAETGGKNAVIVTAMSDRDLAIKDVIQSAFGYAGQKCSACSLLICEGEVYDDPHFRKTLRDAAASLPLGTQWNLATKMNPLIRPPNAVLQKGLTSLDEGEEWLLKPEQDPGNPNLWSPGIKLGVKEGSFTHQNELFGPVLGMMRADTLAHAIQLANGTPYGLTAGLHSLDEREHNYWITHIEAGNCYINRGITGAVVQRQPFGGCKQSNFGRGAKSGGPNYVLQLMHAEQICLPAEQEKVESSVQALTSSHDSIWKASTGSYAFFWKHYFSKDHDPTRVLGQDNLLFYKPHRQQTLRIQQADALLDVMRVIAAAAICGANFEVSGDSERINELRHAEWKSQLPKINVVAESDDMLCKRVEKGEIERLRVISQPSDNIEQIAAEAGCHLIEAPVLANGRVELLNYLREVSLSVNYHRYGYLGIREGERRKPLSNTEGVSQEKSCGPHCCCV